MVHLHAHLDDYSLFITATRFHISLWETSASIERRLVLAGAIEAALGAPTGDACHFAIGGTIVASLGVASRARIADLGLSIEACLELCLVEATEDGVRCFPTIGTHLSKGSIT